METDDIDIPIDLDVPDNRDLFKFRNVESYEQYLNETNSLDLSDTHVNRTNVNGGFTDLPDFRDIDDSVIRNHNNTRFSVDTSALMHLHSQLPGIQHFQPQISSQHQCVALAFLGHHLFTRKWMKIDCSQYFNNITVICESRAQSYFQPGGKHLDQAMYANIESIKKMNGTLRVVTKYCAESWFHVEGNCYKIAPLPVEEFECFLLNGTETVTSLGRLPWKYITQYLSLLYSLQFNIYLCSTTTTSESLAVVNGLHQCEDFTFIAEHHVCDGEADCPDALDEVNCNDVCTFDEPKSRLSCYTMCSSDICTCSKLYFQCSTTGGCISLSKFCDGVFDCQDMSDEILCVDESQATDGSQFTCISGKRIDMRLVNDTVPDCPMQGDDEMWLSDSLPSTVITKDSVMVACIPGHPKLFNIHLLCQLTWDTGDHLATCRNGAHLSNCIYYSCPHQYKCPYSYCIPVQAVCDGRMDCPDGSDETDCHHHFCPYLLKCKSKDICVHKNDVNDGTVDCPDFKDDEITVGIKPCPTECSCVGHAVYCGGHQGKRLGNHASFARALVLKTDAVLTSNTVKYSEFVNLRYLDLSNNEFDNIQTYSFHSLQSLVKLLIANVSLSVIPQYFFQSLTNARDLLLRDNNIKRIETYAFSGMTFLPELDLSLQMLSDIESCSFQGLDALVRLNVSYNLLEIINQDTLCGIRNLQVLDLTGNNIINVDPSTYLTLSHLYALESSIPGMCCYVDIPKCSPQFEDDFASCTNILALSALQYTVWPIAIFSIIENVFALVAFQSATTKHSKKKLIHNLNQKHLALSDVIMGFYFLILAIFNAVYEGHFIQVAHLWKDSLECKIISFMSLVSFEMTLYMVFIMSLGRFIALCMPMTTMFTKMTLARVMVVTGWLFSLLIAGFPAGALYLQQKGLNNALCVMMLSFEHLDSWYVLIVLILNTTISLCNIVMYSSIIHLLRRRQQRLTQMTCQQNKRTHGDVIITVRIICVVLTNSTCWMVMVIVGVLLKSGLIMEPKIFSMCTVTVLPVSAILNPILNVFTTSDFMTVLKNIKCQK